MDSLLNYLPLAAWLVTIPTAAAVLPGLTRRARLTRRLGQEFDLLEKAPEGELSLTLHRQAKATLGELQRTTTLGYRHGIRAQWFIVASALFGAGAILLVNGTDRDLSLLWNGGGATGFAIRLCLGLSLITWCVGWMSLLAMLGQPYGGLTNFLNAIATGELFRHRREQREAEEAARAQGPDRPHPGGRPGLSTPQSPPMPPG